MSLLWRGALGGGIAGLVLLVLLFSNHAGPLEDPLFLLLIVLMAMGSPFLPPGPPPGPLPVPRFGLGADIFAYIGFVVIGMGVGWIVVFIWMRAARHGMRILGSAVAAWLVALAAYLAALRLAHREPASSVDLLLLSGIAAAMSFAVYLPSMAVLRRRGFTPRWAYAALGAVTAVLPVSLTGAAFATSWFQFVHELVSPESGFFLGLFVAFGSAFGWVYGATAPGR